MSKLLVILGPTAAGKSQVGLEVARQHGGEIICADSRTIYRELDIGTAKPSKQELLRIPHHLLNILDPDQSYSAAQFKQAANQLIEDIACRGKLPIMVGGSGLYIDSVLFDYQFPAGSDNPLRQELNQLSEGDLLLRLDLADLALRDQIDIQNRRRVIRAIETAGQPRAKSGQLRAGTFVVGLAPNNEVIRQRIRARAEHMINAGLVKEIAQLSKKYGWDCPALTATGYRQLRPLIDTGTSQEELTERLTTISYQLSRRQLSWFRRNHFVHWVEGEQEAMVLIADFLEAA